MNGAVTPTENKSLVPTLRSRNGRNSWKGDDWGSRFNSHLSCSLVSTDFAE